MIAGCLGASITDTSDCVEDFKFNSWQKCVYNVSKFSVMFNLSNV
jgi:hypothetical protein